MKEDALSQCLKNESNQETTQFSELSALELVTLINSADMTVAYAVQKELPAIAKTVEKITERLQKGGRIFYVGAGTSGRLAALGGSFLFLLLTGLHQGLIPIHTEILNTFGLNYLFPILAMGGMGQVGSLSTD